MTPSKISDAVMERLCAIRLAVFDIDGTLTDGSLRLTGDGEIKVFHAHDGAGLRLLMRSGIEVALITARTSPAARQRAGELGIAHLIQDAENKREALAGLQERLGLKPSRTAAMGDDLPDLGLFARAGLKMAVPEAVAEIRAEADWIATRPAGRGAAREAAEAILKAQGHWEAIVKQFRGTI